MGKEEKKEGWREVTERRFRSLGVEAGRGVGTKRYETGRSSRYLTSSLFSPLSYSSLLLFLHLFLFYSLFPPTPYY